MQTNDFSEDQADTKTSGTGLMEQPGGRVLVRDGTPVGVANLQIEAASAFAFLQAGNPWLGPVCEAAVLWDDSKGAGRATVITPWGDESAGEYADARKHAAFVAHVRAEVGRHHAWVFPLLDSARVGLVLCPAGVFEEGARFSVSVAVRPGAQWDVPALLPLLALAPFAIDGETAQ